MKAVILAAGRGKRMGDLTLHTPKPVVMVGERPFLYYLIKILKKCGIDEIGIVVGYKKEKILEFLENHRLDVSIIEQKEQLGTGHAVKITRDFVKDNDFLVINGDNLFSINDIKSIIKHDSYSYVGAVKTETPEKYGVLVFDEHNNIKEIAEKPKEFVGNTINAGIYKFTKEIFSALEKIKLSVRGEYELTDAITLLADENKIKVLELKDRWADLTKPEDIAKVEEYVKGHLSEFCE